jgi:hypothetical protein
MAKKPTLTTVASGYQSTTMLNANLNAINDALDNTVSLDGSVPNVMTADFDLNSNDLLNVATANIAVLKVAGVTVTDYTSQPSWSGPWVTATAYAVDTLAEDDGSVYICVVAHTSGTFATDLAAVKWQLFSGKSLPQSFLDEDDMASDDATAVASQQSIKAYVDASGYTLLDEDAMGTNSATAVASQQSIKAYVDTTVLASTAEVRTGASGKYITPAAAHAATAIVTLTDATNIAFDFTSGYAFEVTLTDNRTLADPTNGVPGQSRVIRVIQDAGGTNTLAFDTAYKGAYGILPTISTGANEYSLLNIYCVSASIFVVSALINCS